MTVRMAYICTYERKRRNMSEPAEKMVLRTVYLPPALDEKLRVHAFRSKVSKNDLVRRAIERELAEVPSYG